MYTVEQRVFLFRKYWQTGSFKAWQTAFRMKCGERRAPSKCCIQKLVKKLETTGSLLTQHAGGRKMSEETIHDVKERLLVSPTKSLRRLSQETNLPYSTCQRAAKKAKTHAYRVSCVQELHPMHHEKRVRFCLWIKDFLTQNPGILDVTFFTDEAWFHLSGYVNSQNTCIWAAENPHTGHEEPLHSQKIAVWCGVSRRRIIGPIL